MELNENKILILDSIIKDDEVTINSIIDKKVINELYFSENDFSSTNDNINGTEEENNNKITKINLHENENSENIKKFTEELNEIIVQKNSFELIEKVLCHPSLQSILSEFRESDVLIKAIKKENIDAIKWLLNMNIDMTVQDKNGMTALILASKNSKLLFVVQHLIFNFNSCINITDNNNESALFHAINNIDAFRALVNSNIDLNHLNNNKDSVLLVCCRKDIMEPVKVLSYSSAIDANIVDKEGYTGSMYLVKNRRYHEFQLLTGCNLDLDFRNEKNETLLSILVQCVYKPTEELDKNYFIPYIKILMILVQMDCNMNIAIDEEGNTPLMFFIMIEDIYTVHYIVTYCRNLDVSVKNRKGESAFSLSLKLQNRSLIEILMNHKSFDFSYVDKNNNNLLMLYSLSNNMGIIKKSLDKNVGLLNEVNNKDENALIIATKAQNIDAIKIFLNYDDVNINQQDYLGNTALHYAIQLENKYIINLLANARADSNLRNKEGKTALDLAKESDNEMVLNLLNNPTPINENGKLKKKSKSKSKIFSLNKIKKIGSKRMNSSSSSSSIKSYESNKESNIDYGNMTRYKEIIDFSINDDENTYSPLKYIDVINEVEMETYGYGDVVKPDTGVSKSLIRKALALETVLLILDTTGKFI